MSRLLIGGLSAICVGTSAIAAYHLHQDTKRGYEYSEPKVHQLEIPMKQYHRLRDFLESQEKEWHSHALYADEQNYDRRRVQKAFVREYWMLYQRQEYLEKQMGLWTQRKWDIYRSMLDE